MRKRRLARHRAAAPRGMQPLARIGAARPVRRHGARRASSGRRPARARVEDVVAVEHQVDDVGDRAVGRELDVAGVGRLVDVDLADDVPAAEVELVDAEADDVVERRLVDVADAAPPSGNGLNSTHGNIDRTPGLGLRTRDSRLKRPFEIAFSCLPPTHSWFATAAGAPSGMSATAEIRLSTPCPEFCVSQVSRRAGCRAPSRPIVAPGRRR